MSSSMNSTASSAFGQDAATGTGTTISRNARGCLFLAVIIFLASWTMLWVGENPYWLRDEAMERRKSSPSSSHNESSILRSSLTKSSTTNLTGRAKHTVHHNSQSVSGSLQTVEDHANFTPSSSPLIQTSYPIGYDFLFWNGKNRICDLIRNITGVEMLGTDEPLYIHLGDRPPPLVNLTLHCEELMSNTGNWITAIYHIRLAAALGRVDFQFQCDSGMELAEVSMLPWFSGRYPVVPSIGNEWAYDFGWPEPGRVCSKTYANLPLHHLAHEMQRDLRRIAITMLGSRHFSNFDLIPQQGNIGGGVSSLPELLLNRPLLSKTTVYPLLDLEIDDAAIHFRCGDVFGGTNKDVYGLIKFREYVQRIPKETTRRIGIHTQPFDVALVRGADQEQVHDCEKVVHVLVDYLQEAYPNATITIRNTKDDTIPITYARMTMAAQTITTMSTFGIFPAIGSFGEGYFQKSGRQNKFAHEIPAVLSNFHAMDGPILSSPTIRRARWEDIIQFLTVP